MDAKMTNILSLSSDDAVDFFLKMRNYCGFELPEYFSFDELLMSVRDKVADTPYDECLSGDSRPESLPDVNADVVVSKDGKYAVRPFVLSNPFLYYFLVRELCGKEGWPVVKRLFSRFAVPHVTACALPVAPASKEDFYQSATILNWWEAVEQRSIELSLEYRYMFISDISNCYGSVDPRTIGWAFRLKDTEFDSGADSSIACNVMRYLRALQQGRNVGIPQGSAIFDFIAEIILGYADLLLHETITRSGVESPYEIIRYRDDYRIFCNDKHDLEKISYMLQDVLGRLNFRMNSEKTRMSESLVTDSVKPAKLFYIFNTPISNHAGHDFDSVEKHLLFILMFARKYPNSGQIKTLLSALDRRVEAMLSRKPDKVVSLSGKWGDGDEDDEDEDDGYGSAPRKPKPDFKVVEVSPRHCPKLVGGSVRALVAIAAHIAVENVTCAHYALRTISRMVDSLDDEAEKGDIVAKVYAKLRGVPNSDYLQVWLQNMTLAYGGDSFSYDTRLCRFVAGEGGDSLWDNSWLRPDLVKGLPWRSVVDDDHLSALSPVIRFRETPDYDSDDDDVPGLG